MARRPTSGSALGLGLLVLACEREPAPVQPAPSASVARPALSAAPVKPPTRRDPDLACRALRVEGTVRRLGSESPVRTADPLDGRAWVELADGAKLSIRHATSARELAAAGPALLLPCVGGEEHFLLAKGTLETSQGPGARPGAEVVIATPLGSVHYADASLAVRAQAGRVEVSARTGGAGIEPAAGARLDGKAALGPKSRARLTGTPKLPALVEACESRAAEAETLAKSVIGGGDAGPKLGERAAAHVAGRRRARGACMTASAAAALAPEPDRSLLLTRVAAADRLWKAVPRPAGAPRP